MKQANYNELLDALEFAEGGIIDAIAHEDGLDGATGLSILEMIWPILESHDRQRTATPTLTKWLRAQYRVPKPHAPVSITNRKLEAEIHWYCRDCHGLFDKPRRKRKGKEGKGKPEK